MTRHKKLSPEQEAKRLERKAKFKALWKEVAELPADQRSAMSIKYGFRNTEGHLFSGGNSMLIALQSPQASVLAGFRQWLKQGRCVKKGEHGVMIWVPVGGRKSTNETTGETTTESADRPGFVVGTVFDISQTVEVGAEETTVETVIDSAPALQLIAA